jgi:hypothetical protein
MAQHRRISVSTSGSNSLEIGYRYQDTRVWTRIRRRTVENRGEKRRKKEDDTAVVAGLFVQCPSPRQLLPCFSISSSSKQAGPCAQTIHLLPAWSMTSPYPSNFSPQMTAFRTKNIAKMTPGNIKPVLMVTFFHSESLKIL